MAVLQETRQISVTLDEHPQKAGAAHLGVRYRPGLASAGAGGGGLFIEAVAPGSPAAAAGLSRREVITAVDGTPVSWPRHLLQALAERQPNDTIRLTVAEPTSEASQEVTVTLGEHPGQTGRAFLGLRFSRFPSPQYGDFCHQCW